MGGSSGEFSAMGESLTEQCRVEVEGLRVVNFFSRRRSNDGLNPGQAVETTKLEYGKGRGNFQWSGEMRRDRKALCWADTDTERRKLGERMGLDTPVVLAINDGY
ncbi:transcription factor RAX1-like [Quillaja saponaria]|uniref:Transcription factor RAX1-like n=1 Tax=Quillaja saponaria TaxID=32244 RepID=A0AAD7Q7D9_QUISA|nr:transcription factor RAX1-like [Quillaja saponaria]